MLTIKESDWKHLRQLKSTALDRLCNRILSDVEKISFDKKKTSHERYLAVFALIRERDKELARIFDDLKRSNAIGKLLTMRAAGLFEDAEWDGFSEEIKSTYAQWRRL